MRLTSEQFKDYQELVSVSKMVLHEYFYDRLKIEDERTKEIINDLKNIVKIIEGEKDG